MPSGCSSGGQSFCTISSSAMPAAVRYKVHDMRSVAWKGVPRGFRLQAESASVMRLSQPGGGGGGSKLGGIVAQRLWELRLTDGTMSVFPKLDGAVCPVRPCAAQCLRGSSAAYDTGTSQRALACCYYPRVGDWAGGLVWPRTSTEQTPQRVSGPYVLDPYTSKCVLMVLFPLAAGLEALHPAAILRSMLPLPPLPCCNAPECSTNIQHL